MSSSFSRVSYAIPDDADQEEVKDILEKKGGGIVGAMFGKSVRSQVTSSWWLVMEFMVMVHMTRINWYLTTVNTQLVYYTGNVELADQLTDASYFSFRSAGSSAFHSSAGFSTTGQRWM